MSNNHIINKFYTAFSQLDYDSMNAFYADNILFSDPVFGVLEGEEVKKMWEMLCKNAKDFSLTYSNIEELDAEYITCNWSATYTFSGTGRKLTNNAKAYMRIIDGKITEHSDAFRLSTWIANAFGLKGQLLGWTGFMKRKVQNSAKEKLLAYMK